MHTDCVDEALIYTHCVLALERIWVSSFEVLDQPLHMWQEFMISTDHSPPRNVIFNLFGVLPSFSSSSFSPFFVFLLFVVPFVLVALVGVGWLSLVLLECEFGFPEVGVSVWDGVVCADEVGDNSCKDNINISPDQSQPCASIDFSFLSHPLENPPS